ncbi:type II toxin-antitoxin system VapC family toxin [Nitrospira sp. Kam-Ns4a]
MRNCLSSSTAYPTRIHICWIPVTIEVADRAAELRARYRLSTPDAVHVATAISGGATGFIGNDKGVNRGRAIGCLVLDEVP